MKVVYMGTPDFAVPALTALHDSGYEVTLCVTQPDKPVGRKQVITQSPVKQYAQEHGIAVYQPNTMRSDEAFDVISAEKPDFIIVAAYGKILPKRILDIPRFGSICIHGSLLPKYRGAAPIQWCVINGEKEAGLTTMLMDEGIDTGAMLLSAKTEIGTNETAGELFDRLAMMSPTLILDTLEAIVNGNIEPKAQDESIATYVSVLKKEDSVIDWKKSAAEIHNLIRGMNPWPVANTTLNGKLLKIYSSRLTDKKSDLCPGQARIVGSSLLICCGDGTMLEINELQAEGSKRMNSGDFIRGRRIADFDTLN